MEEETNPEPATVILVGPLPAGILEGVMDVTEGGAGVVGAVGGAGLVGVVAGGVEDPPQPKDRKTSRPEQTNSNGRKRSP